MGSSRLRHRTNQKPPLCKGQRSGGAVVNDMPVVYQSRAVTEPQREAVSRRLTEGLTVKDNNFFSPVGVAESPQGDGWHAYPAGGYFSVMKSRQKNFI